MKTQLSDFIDLYNDLQKPVNYEKCTVSMELHDKNENVVGFYFKIEGLECDIHDLLTSDVEWIHSINKMGISADEKTVYGYCYYLHLENEMPEMKDTLFNWKKAVHSRYLNANKKYNKTIKK